MALLVTSSVQIARFANALYGVKLGSVTNAAVLEDISVLGSSNAFNSYYTSSFGSMTNAQVATTMLANLGLAGNEAAQAYVEGQLNAAGSAKGAAVLSMLNAFSNLTSDATFGAAATAWNAKVTAAISYTASNTADVTTDFSAPVTSQTFTLTTSVDAFSGGAGDDTISGIVGVSGTFGIGDTIVGGAGTDTLNLLVQSGGQSQVVSLSGVENVNARLLEAGPTSALAVDAIDWAGVTTLSFNNSIDETAIRVSGLTTETTISVQREVDVSVDFRALTSGTDAVSLTLTSAGSGGGTAASLASAGVADIDVDLDNEGLIDTVNVALAAGTNYATLEAGADARTLNITGAGNLYLSTDDLLTSINATAAAGNLNITITGASEAVVKGGAGDDTLILGTTLTNSDSFDGGSGADTITATVGGFNRTLNTQNVETATITFTDSGELANSSTTNITTYNVSAGSAAVAATITQIVDGATIKLTNDDLGVVALDYASGAATTTINVGSAAWSADVGLASLAVTDVASVTLNAVTGISAGATALITTATFDADVKAIVVQTLGGTGSFQIGNGGNASIGGATALTFNANGAANINFDSIVAGAATLTTLSVNTYGVAAGSATLIGVSGTAMTAINLNASGAGGIEIGTVTLGNGSKTGEAAAVSINVTQGAEADVAIGAITTTGGSTVTINASNIQSSGSFYVADVIFSKGDDGSTTGLTQNFTLNAVTVGTAASFEIEAIDLEAATAGAQITIGNILVQNGGAFDFGSASGISASGVANVDVSSINVTIEGSGSATFGGIETTGGAVGAITLNVGTAASATFGTITASAIGAISVMASGSTGASAAGVDFGNMSSETTVGALEIAGTDGANVTFGTIGASGSLGAIAASGAVDDIFPKSTPAALAPVDPEAMTEIAPIADAVIVPKVAEAAVPTLSVIAPTAPPVVSIPPNVAEPEPSIVTLMLLTSTFATPDALMPLALPKSNAPPFCTKMLPIVI